MRALDDGLLAAPAAGAGEDLDALLGDDTVDEPADLDFLRDDALVEAWVERAARTTGLHQVSALSALQRRMDSYPQLDLSQQAVLVRAHQEGRRAARQLAGGTLTGRQRAAAQRAVDDGQRAMEALAGSMFRLVLLICREIAEARFGRDKAMDVLPDLVAEGQVALAEAAGTFDPARGLAFPTFAARRVRDAVRMTVTRDMAVRVAPSWVRTKRIAAVRIPKLTEALGRRPSREELQQDLLDRCMEWAAGKLTLEQACLPDAQRREVMLARLRKQGMLAAIAQIDDVLAATTGPASLDAPVGADSTATLADLLPPQQSDALLDAAEVADARRRIMAVLAELSDRERDIVLRRYGFVDGDSWTYVQIADLYGVSSERIRQIERAVIERLRGDGDDGRHPLGGFLA